MVAFVARMVRLDRTPRKALAAARSGRPALLAGSLPGAGRRASAEPSWIADTTARRAHGLLPRGGGAGPPTLTPGSSSMKGDPGALLTVAGPAKYLQIVRRAGSIHRDGDDVVKLQFDGRAAVAACTLVARPDEVLHIVRDGLSDGSGTHRHDLLSSIPLSLTLLSGHDEGINSSAS